jgi:hypothetical protein
MPRLFGFATLILGLGVGTYLYFPEVFEKGIAAWPVQGAGGQLADTADELALQPVPASTRPAESRTFSPRTPLFAVPQPVPAVRPSATAVAAPVVRATTNDNAWTTDVTYERSNVPVAPAAAAQHPAAPAWGTEQRREQLARDLQKELKRVGCYDGEVDGQWGPGSRRAMMSFMDRVNATLPVDQPDHILLTLVQGQSAGACGKECPGGQVLSGGRCVPRAVVAQAERRSNPATRPGQAKEPPREIRGEAPAVVASTNRALVAPEPLPGRMSIGGPAIPMPVPVPVPAIRSGGGHIEPGAARVAEARPAGDGPLSGPEAAQGGLPVTAIAPPSGRPADRDGAARGTLAKPQPALAIPRNEGTRHVRHAPEPRLAPRPKGPVFASRSRRMVYDLFQRPDRIN